MVIVNLFLKIMKNIEKDIVEHLYQVLILLVLNFRCITILKMKQHSMALLQI